MNESDKNDYYELEYFHQKKTMHVLELTSAALVIVAAWIAATSIFT